ncbi:MAG: helix-turn-helix transcriptional regulator, partial [Fimbriimonadaceae bacterium]
EDDRWWTVPPRSLVLVNGPCVPQIWAARGEHQSYVVCWDKRAAASLSHWLQVHGAKGRQIFCGPTFGEFALVVDRLLDAIQTVGPSLEPMVYGALHEIVARLALSENRVGLTPMPTELHESLARLVSMVRQKPEGQWPLKDAADLVGYSPFHFSRVFKAQVGYGFHEFVDRCRTEYAVNLICTTDLPIDVIATQSGFGTTQGLRESVKEYLGMVPSELRIDPTTAGEV